MVYICKVMCVSHSATYGVSFIFPCHAVGRRLGTTHTVSKDSGYCLNPLAMEILSRLSSPSEFNVPSVSPMVWGMR